MIALFDINCNPIIHSADGAMYWIIPARNVMDPFECIFYARNATIS